jgi:spore maturation protein B
MSDYIIPIVVLLIFIYGITKKVNCYTSFTAGAKKGLGVVIDIFPFIIAIMIMVELFRVSGLSYQLSKVISPFFELLGIPGELCELVLLKPFTGSGSLAMLNNIYTTYGVDSYISRCASVIMGCSETIFYISTIYLSKTKVKRLGYAIPVSLIVALLGAIFSCYLCKVL